MKTKKVTKKLTLSKATIAALNSGELSSARGGEHTLEVMCTQKCSYQTYECCPNP